MAMAATAVCKPLGILPPILYGALSTRQRIKSHDLQRQERSISASFKGFHNKSVNTRRVRLRALRQGDEGKEKCNEGGVEDANTDAPSCDEVPESKCLGSPGRPEPEKEQQQQSSAGKEKPEPCRGRLHGLGNKLGFQRNTTMSNDEDLKKQQRQQQEIGKQPCNAKQPNNLKQPDARCKLRSLWQTVRRPQNLLAVFMTGLLLYAIALFGWQVMVVAVDVTLFVLKCSLVALVLLIVYIFLI